MGYNVDDNCLPLKGVIGASSPIAYPESPKPNQKTHKINLNHRAWPLKSLTNQIGIDNAYNTTPQIVPYEHLKWYFLL